MTENNIGPFPEPIRVSAPPDKGYALTPVLSAGARRRCLGVDFRLLTRPLDASALVPTAAGVRVSRDALRSVGEAFLALADALEGR